MFIQQLSVFIENRTGRLMEVLDTLETNNINVIALSLADSSDYGMLRMMVSDPQKGKDVLKAAGFSAMVTDVICLKVAHDPGSLNKVLNLLVTTEEIGIEYLYAFANGEYASAVIKFSDPQKASKAIEKNGLISWKAEEIKHIPFKG